jgi:hypothetical protein
MIVFSRSGLVRQGWGRAFIGHEGTRLQTLVQTEGFRLRGRLRILMLTSVYMGEMPVGGMNDAAIDLDRT